MKVLLIDNNRISKYDLPEKIEDSFIINYRPMGGKDSVITIEAENGAWKLKSNGSVNIISSSMLINEAELVDYSGYLLKFLGVEKFVVLYAMPTIEPESYKLDFMNLDRITIGNSQNCNICYNNPSVHQLHAEIRKVDNGWIIVACEDSQFQTFVNNELLVGQRVLNTGDVVFLNGFKLIWMRSFLQINNPSKQVTVAGLNAYAQHQTNNTDYKPASDEDQSIDLYNEDDYFYHMPRIKESVEIENIRIDSPPGGSNNEMPFWLSMGSRITMVISAVVMGYNIISRVSSGSTTLLKMWPQILMFFAMIVGSLVLPTIMRAYQRKRRREREKLRQEKYSAYLREKDQEINLTIKRQVQIMKDNIVSTKNCLTILGGNNRNFWCRQVKDDDFLTVRLGSGSIDAPIAITAPEKKFSLDEDNLLDSVYQLTDRYKKVDDVPISVNLVDKNVISFVCNCSYKDKYIDNIILQIVALHSAVNVKIVIFTVRENEKRWEYMKYMPHCWSDDKSVRFFATTQEEMKEVTNALEEELKLRKTEITSTKTGVGEEKVDKKDLYKNFDSYYLIINDNYKDVKNNSFINEIMSLDGNFGFSYMVVEKSMRNLPLRSASFVQVGETEGVILEKNINASAQIRFVNEYEPNIDMREIANKLSNIPLITKEGLSVLPTALSFLEMYGISKVEQFNITNRWKTNNPVTGLPAIIGVYANGDNFKLDLHEKFHGPHGLIAGMTGSGKSEFIITYILSMCINFHPYEVQFVLIDYKGGGLAGAFENKETGVRVPHLAGTITNLDTAEMNRTLVSIESELKRRQRVFNEARDSSGESTIDIYKYQRLYREGQVSEPMSHLFIISDEFAELKSQQPDFMQQLISTARIGRSLGVHLILATQKPSGVVNDQIWSNSKFKVCLKVQDRSDSMEMLKKPDAASIKEPGRFYLQVGYDDFFDKGQSGWAGAKYVPTDRIIRKVDDSVDFVDTAGYSFKSIKDMVKDEDKVVKNYGDQLLNIVKYIHNVSQREGIISNRLWLDAIPAEIFVNNLKEKYNYSATPYTINPIIGEYDSPAKQQQSLLTLDLTMWGNTVIYGQGGSGKENLLTTIIWSSIIDHTPDEVNFHIVDCGAESLKVFNSIPHVGEITTIEDVEVNRDLFSMLSAEIDQRKIVMADYSGSYIEYIENSNEKLPLIVTIINNYEAFLEGYGKMADSLMKLYREGARYGLIFILTAISTNTIRGRVLQNFANKICLQLPNDTDYRSNLGAPKGLFPSRVFGRGLVFQGSDCFEFQTAYVTERRNISSVIKEAGKTYNQAYTSRAKKIPKLPAIVTIDSFETKGEGLNVPIGYSIQNKQPYCYDFGANKINIIATNSMDYDRMSFVYGLVEMFQSNENNVVRVVDFVNVYNNAIIEAACYKDNFDMAMIEINNEIMNNKNTDKNYVYLFLAASGIKDKTSQNGKQVMDNLFAMLNTISNASLIFIDTLGSYKNLQIEPWYKANVDSKSGLWLDADVASQLLISTANVTMDERKLNFRYITYAMVKGKHHIIKHVVKTKEGESNEE